jgi:hypothetical protein
MITAERSNLTPVKVLISNSLTDLELFKDKEENLFLSSAVSRPEGVVYYATTPSLLGAFMENSISLQNLFNKSSSLFVEIAGKEKTALFYRRDIEIELKCGDKGIKELTCNSIIHVR